MRSSRGKPCDAVRGATGKRPVRSSLRAEPAGSNVGRQEAQARARLRKILAVLDRSFPGARLELDFTTPLELLVALILAARSRDVAVNALTPQLFRRYRSAADWANADPKQLENALRKINFHRTKAAGIRQACRALVDRFHGKVPDDLEDLLTLPQVGRKTANVLLANAFGHDVIGVDTHVARLSQRFGFTAETDPDTIEAELMRIVPAGRRAHFVHLMQLHGRRTCIGKRPKCPECPVADLCPYPHKTKRKATTTARR